MRLVLYQGTISGVDGPSGFLCHCRSNNNPHWNLFFYVCYVLASLCLTPPCLWNSVFRPFIQRFHYGTCQLLLILKVVWLQMQPEIKKKKKRIPLPIWPKGSLTERTQPEYMTRTAWGLALRGFWRRNQVKLRYELQTGEPFSKGLSLQNTVRQTWSYYYYYYYY